MVKHAARCDATTDCKSALDHSSGCLRTHRCLLFTALRRAHPPVAMNEHDVDEEHYVQQRTTHVSVERADTRSAKRDKLARHDGKIIIAQGRMTQHAVRSSTVNGSRERKRAPARTQKTSRRREAVTTSRSEHDDEAHGKQFCGCPYSKAHCKPGPSSRFPFLMCTVVSRWTSTMTKHTASKHGR